MRYKSFRYHAASWSKPRRIVAQVEHHAGELFPRVGFIVTNMSLPSRSRARFYNKRGTAEQWIKEGKQAKNWTRLSCRRFRPNEVRLQLAVPAYNRGNMWRRPGLPRRIKLWSLMFRTRPDGQGSGVKLKRLNHAARSVASRKSRRAWAGER